MNQGKKNIKEINGPQYTPKPMGWLKRLIRYRPLIRRSRHVEKIVELAELFCTMETQLRKVIDKLYPVISDEVKVHIVPPDDFTTALSAYNIEIRFRARNFNDSSLEELTKIIGKHVIQELIKIKGMDDAKRGPRIITPGR